MGLDSLLSSIQVIMEEEHIPGLMLGMVTRDSVLFCGGLGYTDQETKQAVTAQTRFRIGSITKSLVALGILKLVEDGKLSLDDMLKDIAPEVQFINPWEATHPIKLIHLLEHTAGFDDTHFQSVHFDPYPLTALEEVQRVKTSLKARWQPGSRHSYSNPGYVVLGYIIEKITEQPYDSFLVARVFHPLGMHHTHFEYNPDDSTYAQGYRWYGGKQVVVKPHTLIGKTASSLTSSAEDMTHLLRMFLNNGRYQDSSLWQQSSIEEMELDHSSLAISRGLRTNYSIANARSLYGSKRHVFNGHGGSIFGFLSQYGYNRELGIGFMLSNNGERTNKRIIHLVTDFLTQNTPPPPSLKPTALQTEYVKPFEGFYQFHNPRHSVVGFLESLFKGKRLEIVHDSLFLCGISPVKEPLIPVDTFIFARQGDPIAFHALATTAEGQNVLFLGNQYWEQKSYAYILGQRLLFIISILLGFGNLIISVVSLILSLFSNKVRTSNFFHLIPTLAFLALLISFSLFKSLFEFQHYAYAGFMTARTVTIYLTSLLFPILSFLSFISSAYLFKQKQGKGLRYYLLISSISLNMLSIYLGINHWWGFKSWTY